MKNLSVKEIKQVSGGLVRNASADGKKRRQLVANSKR